MCQEFVAYLQHMGEVEVSIVTLYITLLASMFTFVGILELFVKEPKHSPADEADPARKEDNNDRLVA